MRLRGALTGAVLLALAAPVVAVAFPAWVRIPIIKAHKATDPPEASVFSHFAHNQYQCSACHPTVFPQARKGFTHDDLDAGRFCATCHDNKTAFSVDTPGVRCATCHHK